MAFEDAIVDHRAKEQLNRVGDGHHAYFASGCVITNFMEDPGIVAETGQDRIVVSIDCDVRDHGDAVFDELRPDHVKVRVSERPSLIIAFVGIDRKRIASVSKGLLDH